MTDREYQALAKKGREERAAKYQAEMQRQIDSVDYYNTVMALFRTYAEIWRECGDYQRYRDYMRMGELLRNEYHRKATADKNPIPIDERD